MLDGLVPLEPLHFFDIEVDIGQEPTLLPDLLETKMAKVFVSWSHSGLHFHFEINRAFNQPHLRGDVVELFIDSRDLKSATMTRFCHHFIFLPEMVDGEIAKEITRFRTEERHPLAHPDLFKVKSKKEKGKRMMEIFIPKEALCGYDPSQFNKLGFNYRVLSFEGDWQVFSASAEDFPIEQHPNLWASLYLVD